MPRAVTRRSSYLFLRNAQESRLLSPWHFCFKVERFLWNKTG
uniref:Uncharacterized protein n=1 Tax=Arundo donax TaxID=35708 RepID=A0A0A8ZZY0_ARUDO